ncbi:Fpg/Nei family DNA glycosylase [Paeniglutamicibacter sp. ABSL32-1]|uniref:DNA-formamidopyrimidine glycosylase family protein n=1 Tax=Paeniglutamicibacter quisquiliarum TaxID=2849498 RepID=UPI001C2CE697|nr:DNA-formamidopyrimidine glycosylase family protein [Paeniglutamicibacter quisquiliarum]MBV1780961.1 Fpg/Nei family DNA glycosylase [Paeniglutamicibacter quisquiliarum]
MPEGDTVFRTARRLEAALGGRTLSLSDFRVPAHATLSLVDWMVESVVSRGKHLLIRTRPPAKVSAPPLSIHSHLLMEGHWDVYATGERWRSPAFKARAVLGNQAFTAVGFELGFLHVLRTTDEVEVIGHLGPDPLGHSWDRDEAVRRLLGDPARPIGLALLDQRLICGLGNVYRSELLFVTRVHPRTPVGEVADLGHLVDIAHRLLHANKDRARRVTTGSDGMNPYWVYGRAGQPCLRCGGTLQKESLAESTRSAERDVYFCASCQDSYVASGGGAR